MTNDIMMKRTFVTDLYPGNSNWAKKVRNMSDLQVIAIYLRNKDNPPKNNKPKESEGDDIPL